MRLPTKHQKITLRIPEGSWKGRYSAYVEEIGEAKLTIAHPMFGGGLLPLMPGDEVVVDYIYHDERLAFYTEVLGRDTEGIANLDLALPEPGAIQRHQLRDFVRLDVSLLLEYLPVEEETPPGGSGKTSKPKAKRGSKAEATAKTKAVVAADPKAESGAEAEPKAEPKPDREGAEGEGAKAESPKLLQGRTMNLSGGGAQIVTSEFYPVGTRLALILHLPEDTIIAEAEVVRVAGEVSTGEAWLGVRFTEIQERDRERIVRYIFSEQRQRRRRGLL